MPDLRAAGVSSSSLRSRGAEHPGIARQDNESGPVRDAVDLDGGLAGTLASLGIVAVPVTMFEWGGYRYTNSRDAIAAAQRAAR